MAGNLPVDAGFLVALLGRRDEHHPWAVAVALVGTNSGYSALVVAHELIHRPGKVMQLVGRALLVTVLGAAGPVPAAPSDHSSRKVVIPR